LTTNYETKLMEALTQITQKVTWRAENILHSSNEVYIDVIEKINVLVAKTGEVIRSEVIGEVNVKSQLSGWPECKFGMNDKLQLESGRAQTAHTATQQLSNSASKGISIEDIKFHQCVKLSDFVKDRNVTFTPPDGIFLLMKYRVSENVIIPFKVFCNVIETPSSENPSVPSSLDLDVNIKALYDKLLYAQEVVVRVPIPTNTLTVKLTPSVGKAKHEPGVIVWRIKKLYGDKECKMKCEVPLIAVKDQRSWSRAPISMEFSIPMFTCSGLRVRFFKVVEPKMNYRAVKWIRYLTKGGDFQFRI